MNTVSRLYRRRIGEILVNQGLISADQLEESLAIQQKTSELLGTILLDLGLVTEADIAKTICIQYQLPFITLVNYEFDPGTTLDPGASTLDMATNLIIRREDVEALSTDLFFVEGRSRQHRRVGLH